MALHSSRTGSHPALSPGGALSARGPASGPAIRRQIRARCPKSHRDGGKNRTYVRILPWRSDSVKGQLSMTVELRVSGGREVSPALRACVGVTSEGSFSVNNGTLARVNELLRNEARSRVLSSRHWGEPDARSSRQRWRQRGER